MYQKADYVITPSEYSKHLIQSYGVTTPIIAVSNGIDLEKYKKDPKKKKSFASILISKKAKRLSSVQGFILNVKELKIS